MVSLSAFRALALAIVAATAATASEHLSERAANPLVPYAPLPGLCPSTKLVRTANGLGSSEAAWFAKKKTNADAALRSWLRQFGTFSASSMPTIGSAYAGGFYRASLLGAGIHQQLDGLEGRGPMAGLLQAMSYETTLSGSAAFQGSLMQNNWASIASLSSGIWQPRYSGKLVPSPPEVAEAAADVATRTAAGYPATLIDLYGRFVGYGNLYPPRGGVGTLFSDSRNQAKFANAQVPLPIMTAVQAPESKACGPGGNGTQWEFTPFEFGSWDNGVAAFMDMKYLGTRMNNGAPALPLCTTGYDNLGLLIGTSANTIAKFCNDVQGALPVQDPIDTLLDNTLNNTVRRAYFGTYPNPFFGLSSAPKVASLAEIPLEDGGNTGQVIPLWPLLQRQNIDVTFVWDNYYDAPPSGFGGSTGQQLFNTYAASRPANLKRMPVIPSPSVFKQRGFNTKPTAFGCNDNNVQTFIYVPYQAYIPQTQSVRNLTTTPKQTRDYVLNGNLLATNNNNANWPRCVACLIMKKKASSLPSFCSSCFSTYCYN